MFKSCSELMLKPRSVESLNPVPKSCCEQAKSFNSYSQLEDAAPVGGVSSVRA